MVIITKLLYVKPDVARAQPTTRIRTSPEISDTSWQLWTFMTLSDCQTPPFEKFSEEETFSRIPARSQFLTGISVKLSFHCGISRKNVSYKFRILSTISLLLTHY